MFEESRLLSCLRRNTIGRKGNLCVWGMNHRMSENHSDRREIPEINFCQSQGGKGLITIILDLNLLYSFFYFLPITFLIYFHKQNCFQYRQFLLCNN